MVGFVFASKHREMEALTKEGWGAHKDSEGTHSVVGHDGGACRRWGDHPGKDDTLLAEGVDGVVGGWLGDAEDPGEPPD